MILDDLRIVLPVGKYHAYHTPITKDVFHANFQVIAATKAALFEKGPVYAADVGVQIASLTLKDEGKREALKRMEEGDMGASSLLSEIKRLTLVLLPQKDGWNPVPVDTAIQNGEITREEWEELESQLVFFTSLWCLTRKPSRQQILDGVSGVLNLSPTSSTPTEWRASSPTSTSKGTGETASSARP